MIDEIRKITGDNTTDVVINGTVQILSSEDLDEYHTTKMQERVNILEELKALQ